MRRIPGQEYTPDAVAIDHAHCRLVDRTPCDALDAMARDFVHRRLSMPAAAVFALEVNWNSGVFGNGQSPIGAAFGERPDMPVAAIESFDLDVCHEHRLVVDRLALQPQAERFSHRAVAAVAPDQEVRSYPFTGREYGIHSVLVLRERRERLAEFDLAAQRCADAHARSLPCALAAPSKDSDKARSRSAAWMKPSEPARSEKGPRWVRNFG